MSTVVIPAIGAGQCKDAYFEVDVTQTAAAFDTTRRYHITATDVSGSVSTPTPRELYVEHLISQNRNSVTDVKYGPLGCGVANTCTSVAAGGSMNLVVGNSYDIQLLGGTATQGYNQFEAFINFPNTIFSIQSVNTTYSADNSPFVPNPNDKLYADACLWENDPNSPAYRSCVGGDFKAGGSNVVTTYSIKIVSGGGTSQTLGSLLYDFSGSSYHYNADFGVGARIANIIDPTAANISKSFTPNPTNLNGISALKITLTNPNAAPVGGYNFVDNLPANLIVATPPAATTSGCGAPALTAVAGSSTISFSNGTVAANGNCVISVNVTPTATGSLVNTTNHLFIDANDTGHFGTATLTVNSAPPPGTGLCGVTMASWTVPVGTVANPPDLAGGLPTAKAANVATATLVANVPADTAIVTTGGHGDTTAWRTNGYKNDGNFIQFTIDTTNYTAVHFSFWVANPSPANGPSAFNLTINNGGGFGAPIALAVPPIAFTNYNIDATGLTNVSGNTIFRLTATGANNDAGGASFNYDDMLFTGCTSAVKATIAKTFVPNPIAVGAVSTLTFTLTNTNTAPLTGATFTDSLPSGVQVAATPVAATTCGGTWTPAAGNTTLNFSGGTIPASGSCTVSVNVTATTAGPHTNTSGFLATTEGGTNTTSVGTAPLTAVLPPSMAKAFAPSPILAGGISRLTFTITNPNPNDAISGVAFGDTFPVAPGAMTVAGTPNPSTSGCGAPTFSPVAGAGSIAFSGGTIAAGGTCTVALNITAPVNGTYNNTSGNVSHIVNGVPVNGNTASASLTVNPPTPSIGLLKQVSTTATGPWESFLAIASGSVFYRFTVENTGDVPLTLGPATITDNTLNVSTCNAGFNGSILPVAVAGNDNHIVTCVVGPVASSPGSHTNTASAHATFGGNPVDSPNDSATYATTGLTLVKSATETTFTNAGDVLHYSYLVTNSGFAPLQGPVTVADDHTTVTCPAVNTVGDFDNFLDPGESVTCTATYIVTGTDVTNGFVTNTASATADGVTSPPDSKTVNFAANADLVIAKTDGVASVLAGGTTVYTITVTNNGPTSVTGAILSDPAAAGLSKTAVACSGTPGACVSAPTVAQLESGTFALPALTVGATYQITVTATVTTTTGSVSNVATIAIPPGGTDPTPGNNSATDTDTVTPAADLAITKTDGVATVVSGNPTTYTITVTNNGPSSVTGAILSDPPATGLSKTAVACSGTPGTCVTAPTVAQLESGTFALPVLASGATYQITVTADVTAASGSVTNTATIAPPAGTTDPTPGNNSASDIDGLGATADLMIAKTDGVTNVLAGSTTVYTITVTNNGPSGVAGAILSDPAVAGLSKTAVACSGTPGNCVTAPTVAQLESGSFALPALANGETYQITVTATVTATSGSVSNTATVADPPGTTEPNPGDNTATDTDTVDPLADLLIAKDDGVTTVLAGAPTTYTITVTNNGPSAVTGAILTDAAATGLSKTSVVCSGTPGACVTAPNVAQLESGTFALPTLTSGATYQIAVTATVTATSGSVSNVTTIAEPAGTSDSNQGNNNATDTDTVTPSADLVIAKTDGVTSVVAGTPTTYTITVTNNGPSSVTGAILSDPAATGLSKTAVACSGTPGACVAAPTVAQLESGTFALPALTSGATYQITVTANVTATSGSVSNVTTIAVPPGTTDPTPGNNTATDTDTVTPSADLIIAKTDGVTSVLAGTPTTYTITVTNNGPSSVTGAVLSDPAATGLSKTAVACSGTPGQCVTAPTVAQLESGTFALPALANGATYQITVTATVTATNGSVSNVTTIAPPAGTTDPTPGNNTDTDTDTVTPSADLVIAKTNGVSSVLAGSTTVYTITVTNNGPSSVTGSILSDPVAAGLSKTAVACSGTPGACVTAPTVGQLESGTFALPALSSGATYQITVTATVTATNGSVSNIATIAVPPGTTDPTPGNNTSTDTDTVTPAADLAITKDDGVTTVITGTSTVYTITVTNNGPSSVTGAILSDPPATGLSKTSVACSGTPGTCVTAPTVAQLESGTFALPALANGATYQITVTANVTATSGSVTNVATIAPPAGTTDPTPGNNSASDTDGLGPTSDLVIAKTDGVTSVLSGSSTVYTITVTNNGPSAVTGAILSDPAATGLSKTAVACSGTPGTCVTAPTIAQLESGTFALPALASGATYQITVTATVTATSGSVSNTATIAVPPGTTDPTPGNNTTTDTDTVTLSSVDLAITKTASIPAAAPGQTFDYTLVVVNNGPSTATGVTVADTLPSGFSLISATSTQGTCTGTAAVSCTIGTMLNGASVTITLHGTAGNGSLSNTATVTSNETDTTPANNSSSVNLQFVAGGPTLSTLGLIIMGLLLAMAGAMVMKSGE